MANLPIELVRKVFETATVDHPTYAPKFTLISRDVREWTEPLMYETVILSSKMACKGFLRAINRKGPEFIARHVKVLNIQQPETPDVQYFPIIKSIVQACIGVTNLCCWSYDPSSHFTRWLCATDLHPRRLCLRTRDLSSYDGIYGDSYDGPDMSVPAFYSGLTHLEFGDPWAYMSYAADIARLPQLTYLALHFIEPDARSGMDEQASHFRTILSSESLQVFVLLCRAYQDENGRKRTFYVEEQIRDPRLLMMPWVDPPSRWATECWSEGPTMWDRAEAMVQGRSVEAPAIGEMLKV
ncbi:hypothetical protein BV22DRAFT_1198350 [Leucogyrophana mollusca]|uniref:Uncharacterized protein n=1 Tax=Leucogyrophana mollusca TaxID=85980 RepID=A0ACB8B7Q4_9AGAM|nr:hypothetical protein BV22DRAFT_1198350 [Leucogyrophana mollusca]